MVKIHRMNAKVEEQHGLVIIYSACEDNVKLITIPYNYFNKDK